MRSIQETARFLDAPYLPPGGVFELVIITGFENRIVIPIPDATGGGYPDDQRLRVRPDPCHGTRVAPVEPDYVRSEGAPTRAGRSRPVGFNYTLFIDATQGDIRMI
ncbi:hypothetical protein DL766_006819 [Monosporascus sp. MC13-8B]|uniref:Uncharacterized protein n=1 Tax=Monosporascus cannonballus TaxID=155416 RepID=A0ABY0H759_9PEZI|nr:hypothetical protein DL762_006167 [Monosporascus cannonballus]RYO90974.1 hypothetical protein DL763_005145 [Monosporascus cannonballus]RYP26146.1 hypothetical protein DL766_006819 [Monosporascus sp. MC13-8B]